MCGVGVSGPPGPLSAPRGPSPLSVVLRRRLRSLRLGASRSDACLHRCDERTEGVASGFGAEDVRERMCDRFGKVSGPCIGVPWARCQDVVGRLEGFLALAVSGVV